MVNKGTTALVYKRVWHMNKKGRIIGGTVALLSAVPLLANAIGIGLTAILVAVIIGLGVTLIKRIK